MLALRRTLTVLGALVAVAIVAAAVLAFLTFGIGSSSPSAPATTATAGATTPPGAPASFRDRPPFASCGQVDLAEGAAIPPARIACLAATPAVGRELVVISTTAAGDRIVRYFRTGPTIVGVEIFEDATRDRSDGTWHHSFCRSGQIDQFGACA